MMANSGFLVLICSFVLGIHFCVHGDQAKLLQDEHAYEQYRGYVDEIRTSFAERMRQEMDLRCRGVSGMLHGTVEELGIDFQANRRATIEEARALELWVINQFLHAINTHEKIQPFLEERPFKHNRVQISIDFAGINGPYSDGTVSSIHNVTNLTIPMHNGLVYYAEDPFTDRSIKLLKEPYEQALRLNEASPVKSHSVHQITEMETAIDKSLIRFNEELSEKYGLSCWAIGGKMTKDIEEIGAKYTLFKPATQEEARQLLVEVIQKLMTIVNENEVLRPFLKEYPLSTHRIKMRINFRNNRWNSYSDGTMESVTLSRNQITYFQEPPRKNKDEPIDINTPIFAKESFEEALNVVENTAVSLEKYKPKQPSFFDSVYEWFHSLFFYIYAYLSWLFRYL